MISKNQIKVIQSLTRKKKRDELGLFVAEGDKLIHDLMPQFELYAFYSLDVTSEESEKIELNEMKKITHLASPSTSLAVFRKKDEDLDPHSLEDELVLALDGIQDPGNLGTIIRIADWFGIRHVICSNDTVDIYNSKTIKSTMGAISRVSVSYVDLPKFLTQLSVPIYGTFMDGENIYTEALCDSGVIVMGNEGQGIREMVEEKVSKRIAIPSFGDKSSESLNVAMATGIICSEFRRRKAFS